MNIQNAINQTPFEYTLSIIGGKWKMRILYQLAHSHLLRFNELKRNIPGITHKMLSAQLKELESDGIVIRKEYPQVPPKVEYFLSERGKSLMPVLDSMCCWGIKQKDV
ncbi:helix-turn-helix transcriptional regulator [Clostridium sp. SHJSY1]|uniref:winged helix-turn-helix transcriptional regulator n=1 Tax=Clostridium sp. SHJSY1 TaxID=2942483 RepID=UPI002875EF5E|nr:helix-turn-helix domain-containing protein [Clostridium sp. SHJSY1]MDS0525500.1 helix-turn-helix transcriptional regulator [Clostridium sp. SHJSY1]